LLERYGELSLENENKWETLSTFRSMMIKANPSGPEIGKVAGHYRLLNPLRVKLSAVRLPDAVLLVQGSHTSKRGRLVASNNNHAERPELTLGQPIPLNPSPVSHPELTAQKVER
jgi:hypothetical protein